MTKVIRICLINFILVFSACTDHQLRPLSPLKLRLKSTADADNINATVTYDYDEANRQTSASVKTDFIGELYKSTIFYNSQNQYQKIVKTEGPLVTNIYFSYQPLPQGGQLVTAKTYFQSVPVETLYSTTTYNLDANNHLTSYTIVPAITAPGSGQSGKYYYTGENITKIEIEDAFRIFVYTFDYDNKINPFYGLSDKENELGVGYNAIKTFSRNNVVKTYFNGMVNGNIPVYQYDSQGLLTFIDFSGRYTLNYESY